MQERNVALQVKQPDGKNISVLYSEGKNVLHIDGEEVDSFVIVNKSFYQVYNIIIKSGNALYLRTRRRLNEIEKETMYTVTEDGSDFPTGFIYGTDVPEINSLILRSTWDTGNDEILYGGFTIVGEVMTVDAR